MALIPNLSWGSLPNPFKYSELVAFVKSLSISLSGTNAPSDMSAADYSAKFTAGPYFFGVATLSGADFTLTLSPAPVSLSDGMIVAFRNNTNASNAANPTLNVNGLGAKGLVSSYGNTFGAHKIGYQDVVTCRYNSTTTQWHVQSVSALPEVIHLGTISGSATALTAVLNPLDVTLTEFWGRILVWTNNATNTVTAGNPTLQINSLTAKEIVRPGGAPLRPGDLKINRVTAATYDINLGKFVIISALPELAKAFVCFNGASASTTFTADATTNLATAAAHGMSTGQVVTVRTSTTLPAPLTVDTPYWIYAASLNTFSFHTSLVDASTGANPIDLTTAGTGTQTFDWCAITASAGVAYVIRPSAAATGDYIVGFLNAFSSTGYCAQGAARGSGTGANSGLVAISTNDGNSASVKRLITFVTGGTLTNFTEVHFVFMGFNT